MPLKNKRTNIIKLIIAILIVIITVLLWNTYVKALSYGGVDDVNTDRTSDPKLGNGRVDPYYSVFDWNGKAIFCSGSNVKMLYRENYDSSGVQYANNLPDGYYNQKMNYYLDQGNIETEQSVAAAYKAYDYYKTHPYGKTDTQMREMVNIVLWYSEIWGPGNAAAYRTSSTMPMYRLASVTTASASTRAAWGTGYVANVNEARNDPPRTITRRHLTNNIDDNIVERAEAWANFYYKILQQSGSKLLINTTPTDEAQVIVDVDYVARTYTQGPYKADIVDSSGNVLTQEKTQDVKFFDSRYGNALVEQGNSYGTGVTLGTLLYNEILGQNLGCDAFQFCRLTDQNALEATVKFSNGETAQYDVEILDGNNTALAVDMPMFGEEYYFRVQIPSTETRTVESITYNFNLSYFTKFEGKSSLYELDTVEYEATDELLEIMVDAESNGYKSTWTKDEKLIDMESELTDTFDKITIKLDDYSYTASSFYDLRDLLVEDPEGGSYTEDGYEYTYTTYSDSKVSTALGKFRTNAFEDLFKKMIDDAIMNSTAADGTVLDYKTSNNFDLTSVKFSLSYGRRSFSNTSLSGLYSNLKSAITSIKSEREDDETYYYYDGDLDGDYTDGGRTHRSEVKEEAKYDAFDTFFDLLEDGDIKIEFRFKWGTTNPVITEQLIGELQPVMQIETVPTVTTDTTTFTYIKGTLPPDGGGGGGVPPPPTTNREKDYIVIGGKVWVDEPVTKNDKVNGRLNENSTDNKDYMYAGMQVELLQNGNVIATTTTDANGTYQFRDLDALKKYVVRFTYNGQIYEDTYYKDDLSGGFSNAQDVDRELFNNRFETIDSSPNSYNNNGYNKAYGLETKLQGNDGEHISYDGGALSYGDAWNKFVELATVDKSYAVSYTNLENWLRSEGVGTEDTNGVVKYIQDCMITAVTREYPVYDRFVTENLDNPASQPDTVLVHGETLPSLYTGKSDQSRNVDFGIYVRDTADLAIQKDVYKATVRVNGKTQTYMYNKKDANIDEDGTWNVEVRAGDSLYNGEYRYTREIRKSEYLYDGEVYSEGGTSAKDLQVYITYRIIVRNQSQTYDTKVEEIVDYYDEDEFEFDGELDGNRYELNEYRYDNSNNTYVNSYIGDREGNKIGDLTVRTTSILGNNRGDTQLGDYTPIYLTGMTDYEHDRERIPAGGGMTFIYLTFKVKTHTDETGMEGRVRMDVNTESGRDKGVGKRNLAEINGYSTYYRNTASVPDTLDSNNKGKDKTVSNQVAGLVDNDSIAGNLREEDLNGDGDLIVEDNEVDNRAEDDTDKAPNIRLVFPEGDEDERTFTGYVYEDERNQESDLAAVGNGIYDEGETKINGVTVQLVELIQNVDENGIPYGDYLGEYVWNAMKYDENEGWVNVNSIEDSTEEVNNVNMRYYSGQKGTLSPILSGKEGSAIEVSGYEIDEEGEYGFKAVPAGDMFIRFIYGDTTQTTLTKADGEGAEVVSFIAGDDIKVDNEKGFITKEGLNAKSYNGQDYKSTIYQAGIDQGKDVEEYNGIKGFTNYDTQNYNITTPNKKTSDYVNRKISTEDGKDKNVMYHYDIEESSPYSGISDAKDVGNIRTNVTEYGSGEENIDGEADHRTLVNGRAEVLTAGLKIGIKEDKAEQVEMIKEEMDNTAMVSQTGIINVEVEYNRKQTNNQGDKNEMGYLIEDIDLGLTERPRAQLKLNKEVSNLKITLADGTTLFDTGKSVNNVPYDKHEGHSEEYSHIPNGMSKAYRLTSVTMGENTEKQPEIITAYMDEELMYGARIELYYTYKVTNIGEVDYLDNQFYYTGKTNNTGAENISTTQADTVIDYVSNNLQFIPTNSNNKDWSLRTVEELTGKENINRNEEIGYNGDLVNDKYQERMKTYNAIITTKALGDEKLWPEEGKVGKAEITTNVLLSSTLVPDTGNDSMVYNNLVEIVQTSNSQGRRMEYTVAGNQPMADQSLGTDAVTNEEEGIYTKADLVTPTEIDSDSSQQVLILPPTGANRNYVIWIITGIIAVILIGGAIILIKKKLLNKE